jgi:hypothetical protein
MIRPVLFVFLLSLTPLRAALNDTILAQIRTMPEGGGYATTLAAHQALAAAVQPGPPPRFTVPRPSYCSGATYLVFLKALAARQTDGRLSLTPATWQELVPRLRPDGSDTLPDGESLWGRWNSNGPGAARLFAELGLGRNFTDYAEARPGDLLKIFWTDAVGKRERGHLVVFLGEETRDGQPFVRFWSSNQPDGYGEKSVPKSSIARAIFSRLEHPERLNDWKKLPVRDDWLAGLLREESTFAEALRRSAVR